MKKVLILAYDFPPYVSVGGLRPYSWYKYFKEFGIHPVVVTRQWGNEYGNHLDYIAPSESFETIIEETEFGTIIRTPYKPNLANRIMLKYGDSKFSFIRKVITAYYEFAQFLFFVGTKSELYFGAKKYLKENKVDCIIATGEPFVLFKYASKLNSKFNIPWIADYRDPWTQSSARSKNFLYKAFNSCIEKQILKSVSKITTVSDFFKNKIETLVKDKEYFLIRNGYDNENAESVSQISQTKEKLSIAYAGSLYDWHPIEMFFDEMERILQQNKEMKIVLNFYGLNNSEKIVSLLEHFPKLHSITHIFPKIQNAKLLEYLAQNNVLLLFNDYSILGTKIYDYLSVKRHILLCFKDDEKALNLKKECFPFNDDNNKNNNLQEQLILEKKAGTVLKNKEELQNTINNFVVEHQQTQNILCMSEHIEDVSRKSQAKLLVNLLNNL